MNFLRPLACFFYSKEFLSVLAAIAIPVFALLAPWQQLGCFPLSRGLVYFGMLTLIGGGFFICLRSVNTSVAYLLYSLAAFLCFALSAFGIQILATYSKLNVHTLSNFIYVIKDSHLDEAIEYMLITFKWWFYALFAVAACIVFCLYQWMKAWTGNTKKTIAVAASLMMVTVGVSPQPLESINLLETYSLFQSAIHTHRDDMTFMKSQWNNPVPDNINISRPGNFEKTKETFVWVIGESTGRENMQLYGYERTTTPNLSSKRDALFVFQDVVSPHSHTIPVLKKIFTFADFENEDLWKSGTNIITIFKKAGFKVIWLSNQPVQGGSESWTTAFAGQADSTIYMNLKAGLFSEDYLIKKDSSLSASKKKRPDIVASYDDVLIKPFKKVLQDEANKKLIILHLIGTHTNAVFRYPKKFSYFDHTSPLPPTYAHIRTANGRKGIDEYDNAVRFNDFVVSEFIREFQQRVKKDERASLIYMSDHGEEVKHIDDSYIGHSESQTSRYMFEIPLLAWFNETIKKELTINKGELETRPYQTVDWIHAFLDLAKIETPQFKPEKSLFSKFYKPQKRIVNFNDYDSWRKTAGLKDPRLPLPAAGKRNFRSRVWVHRTNSIEKLNTLKDKYSGFELDIVFDKSRDRFEVDHITEPTHSGLGLDEYLQSLKNPKEKQYWLDFKNLSEENAKEALDCLKRIVDKHGVLSNVIVESPRPDLLTRFTDRGFYTSFYLPARSSYTFLGDWLHTIKTSLGRSRVNAISTTDADYQNIKQGFLEYDVLLWHPIDLAEVKRDQRVKVVLVKEQTPYER